MGFSALSFSDFQFNFMFVWEQTLYHFCSFKLIKAYIMAQNVVYLSECLMWTQEKNIFCCLLDEVLKGVSYIQLINGAVEFNCVFIDFLIYLLFLAALGFRLVVASGGYVLLQCTGFSLWWLLLWSTGYTRMGFS